MKKLIISISLLGILFSGNVFAQTQTSGRSEVYHQSHTKSPNAHEILPIAR